MVIAEGGDDYDDNDGDDNGGGDDGGCSGW